MSDKDWENRAEKFDKHPLRTVGLWAAGLLGVLLLISAGLWALGVFSSPIQGKGDAYKQKNSAQNWTSAQAGFQRDFNSFQSFKQQIIDAKQTLDDFDRKYPNVDNGTAYNPLAEQRANLQRNVTGVTQQCQNTATNYNTAAQSYLSQDFRDASLPDHLDPAECSNAKPLATAVVPSASR